MPGIPPIMPPWFHIPPMHHFPFPHGRFPFPMHITRFGNFYEVRPNFSAMKGNNSSRNTAGKETKDHDEWVLTDGKVERADKGVALGKAEAKST